MKKLFSILILVFILPISSYSEGKLDVSTDSSFIKWKGSKITGSHSGTVKIKSADAEMDKDKGIKGSFVIDMASINVTDIKDPTDNKKLQGHLKSEDFFKTVQFPVSKFVIKEAKPFSGPSGNYIVKGSLEVLGLSNDIEFPANVEFDDATFSATADVTIDRTKWNIKYGSGKFFKSLGDRVIYDDIELQVNLTGSSNS